MGQQLAYLLIMKRKLPSYIIHYPFSTQLWPLPSALQVFMQLRGGTLLIEAVMLICWRIHSKTDLISPG
jgi:hypothetical protein